MEKYPYEIRNEISVENVVAYIDEAACVCNCDGDDPFCVGFQAGLMAVRGHVMQTAEENRKQQRPARSKL